MSISAVPAFLVAALLAAPGSGWEPRGAQYHYSPKEAEQAMADFSKCVIGNRRSRVQAEHFLRAVPGSRGFRDEGFRLATPDCVPRALFSRVRLRFDAKMFRDTLFTALYQHDFGHSPPPDVKSVPPLVIAAEFDGNEADIPATVSFERAVGDCVARADPAGVHRLLMTKVASSEEKEALQQVVPQLSGCIPAGQRAAFSRSVFRGVVAEALYKLRRAASAPATLVQAGAH